MNTKSGSVEKYSAPALSKGLDILELLASQNAGLKKSEIARTLDRSISEIFRMLAVLTDRGYVCMNETTEQYSLTLKMFGLAHEHPPIKRLTTIATDIMADLAVSLNQSVHLAILHGSEIFVIAQNDPPGNNVTSVRLGARIPVTQTSSGAVICSHFSKEKLDEICGQITPERKEQVRIFRQNVTNAAANGYCVAPSMVIAGVQNISAPILDHSGNIVASLTIPYIQRLVTTTDPDIESAKTELVISVENISNLLGANLSEGKH